MQLYLFLAILGLATGTDRLAAACNMQVMDLLCVDQYIMQTILKASAFFNVLQRHKELG